jgi:ABC-type uncharacterized transport system substrate-binding protein
MQFDQLKRREFITLLGGASVSWPLVVRAQQPAMPVIGFLDPTTAEAGADRLRVFRQGLKDTGYVEGENVAIVYRFAENQVDRLPELAADLVRRQVTVIATFASGPLPAKAATVLNASTSGEINAAFITLVRDRLDALFVFGDPFFSNRRVQIVNLASRHAVPATYSGRQFVEAGGLMSYGSNLLGAWHQFGVYTGRILKGAKPADLPVVQSSKFELVINTETARMLGLTVPDKLLVAADEVIE